MYKLIIAEDDEILLEGISKGINWEKMDITVVAAVNDGIYVMEKLRETDADILLTDIRMSKKSGLEVLKEIHDKNPEFPVIMLTAYEEFDYVKTALQYGAVDYLLKPLDISQLENVIKKAQNKIKEQVRYREIQWRDTLNQCLKGRELREKTDEKFAEMQNKSWNVLEIIPNCSINELTNVEKIIMEYTTKNRFYVIDFEVGHILIICCADELLVEKRDIFLKELQQKLWDEAGCKIIILLGRTITEISELCYSYEDVKKLREYQFCEEFGGRLEIKDIRKYENQVNGINKMLLNNIVNAISLGKVEFLPECIKKLKERLRDAGSNSLLNMAYSLSIIYEELHRKINQMEKNEEYFQKLYANSLSCKNLDEAMKNFEKVAIEIAYEMREKQDNSGKMVACKAKQYIDEQYAKSDLRISDIAKELGISPNYLSKLFLEEIGENFSDYLIDIRMKAAQKLLIYSNYTMQEIAQKVGYDNISYFSVLFKKYTGITAGKYRKNIKA